MLRTFTFICAVCAVVLSAFMLFSFRKRGEERKDDIHDISEELMRGELAIMSRKYRVIAIIIASIFFVMILVNWRMAVFYLIGALAASLITMYGIRISSVINSRSALAYPDKEKVSAITSRGSAAMGFSMTGLSLLALTLLYWVLGLTSINRYTIGFAFGVTSVALFATISGGIYTRIYDACATYLAAGSAAMMLARLAVDEAGMTAYFSEKRATVFPLFIMGAGMLVTIVCMIFVLLLRKAAHTSASLNNLTYVASVIMIVFSLPASVKLLGSFNYGFAIISGLAGGIFCEILVNLYRYIDMRQDAGSEEKTQDLAVRIQDASIKNLGRKFFIILAIVAVIVICAFLAQFFAGYYGMALAAAGLLSIAGVPLIARIYSSLYKEGEDIADAVSGGRPDPIRFIVQFSRMTVPGRGYFVAASALTCFALFLLYADRSGAGVFDLIDPFVLVGLLIGTTLPLIFTASSINAKDKVILRLKNQVWNKYGVNTGNSDPDDVLKEGETIPEYAHRVTRSALKRIAAPGILMFYIPVAVGLFFGPASLGGTLAGTLCVGLMIAVAMACSSRTLGGSFGNTSSSVNIMVKVIMISAVTFAPLFSVTMDTGLI